MQQQTQQNQCNQQEDSESPIQDDKNIQQQEDRDTDAVKQDHKQAYKAEAINESSIEEEFLRGWGLVCVFIVWGMMVSYFPYFIGLPPNLAAILGFVGSVFASIGAYRAAFLTLDIFDKMLRSPNPFTQNMCITLFSAIAAVMAFLLGYLVGYKQSFSLDSFSFIFDILGLLMAMMFVFSFLMGLQYISLAKDSLASLKNIFKVKDLLALVLSMIGAVTVIVPFIQLVISLITERH